MNELQLNLEEVKLLINIIEEGKKALPSIEEYSEIENKYLAVFGNTEESREFLNKQRQDNNTFRVMINNIITKLSWMKNELIQ